MNLQKTIIRSGVVLCLVLIANQPLATEEPNDTEPSCSGSVIGYDDWPNHCCWRNSCGAIPRHANGRTFYYQDDCQWTNFHFTLGSCAC